MSTNRHGSIVAGVLCGTLVLSIATANTPKDTTQPSAAAQPSSADAAILAKLVAVDQHEIKAARTAEKEKSAPAPPAPAPAQDVRDGRHPQERLDRAGSLQPLDGDEFERAFLDTMIAGHEEALTMLDEGIASTSDESVKAHLQKTRDAVAGHLTAAQQLQGGGASTGR